MRPALTGLLSLLAALMILATAGCARPGPTYVDEGRAYDQKSALGLPKRLDPGKLAEEPTSDSVDLRHDALVSLRRRGGGAADAAQLITRTFPTDTAGVPFYVERITFESQPAWAVVEAIGRPGGRLGDERVWVLDDDGEILISGTR